MPPKKRWSLPSLAVMILAPVILILSVIWLTAVMR